MKTPYALALLLLLPLSASACISLPPSPSDAARGIVLIGYVTGEEYPDYESTLIKDGESQYPLVGRHIVRVTFTEALGGELIGPLGVETPCYSPKPVSGERAIVVRLGGSDYVVPFSAEYDHAIRDAIALRKGR